MNSRPGTTASPLTRLLGVTSLVALAVLVVLGLWVAPPDEVQGDLARLIYIHPAMAWMTYQAAGVCALGSALYLFSRTRSRFWDALAGASAEICLVFCGLTLVTGSIWGRPTWGVWWTWDARLTSTAVLFTLFVGYLALRRVPAEANVRAKRSAIAALVAVVDVPIVHQSVEWWRTLHQGATLGPEMHIHGIQLFTMLYSFVAFMVLFAWLLVHRFRMERLEARFETEALDLALQARRAEGSERTTDDHQPAGANA
jgi:heme exporter protein C